MHTTYCLTLGQCLGPSGLLWDAWWIQMSNKSFFNWVEIQGNGDVDCYVWKCHSDWSFSGRGLLWLEVYVGLCRRFFLCTFVGWDNIGYDLAESRLSQCFFFNKMLFWSFVKSATGKTGKHKLDIWPSSMGKLGWTKLVLRNLFANFGWAIFHWPQLIFCSASTADIFLQDVFYCIFINLSRNFILLTTCIFSKCFPCHQFQRTQRIEANYVNFLFSLVNPVMGVKDPAVSVT